VVAAIGGSWLAESKVIAERNWKEFTYRVQESVALLKPIRRA
jgi:2-keto-3-deoxy-6-phosphogluconate aldolase